MTNENCAVPSGTQLTFIQNGACQLDHATEANQAWCKKNLLNFSLKASWHSNSPDINPVENLYSTMDEIVCKDHEGSQRGLKQALRNILPSTPQDLSHSMP